MTTKTYTHHLHISGLSIEVVQKEIKNLYISVHPPDGRIRVSAPLHFDEDTLRMAVITRLPWIKRKQSEFRNQERQSEREFVTGETHYFAGKPYRLTLIEKDEPPTVRCLNNTRIVLTVRPGTSRAKKEAVFHQWYRQYLQTEIPPLLTKWSPKLGVTVAEVRIKRMKTLWGSCNITAKRIWLNLELAKKPHSCLRYVLVHEMVHLLEKYHNARFYRLMDTHLPQWRTYRDQLNRTALAHEHWS